MELENTAEDQMATCLFDQLRSTFSWIVVVVVVVVAPLLTFAICLSFGSLSIFFTSTALILSTFLFIFCNRKFVHRSSPQMEDNLASKQHHEALEGESGSYQNHGYLLGSPESTTEDSEEEWPFRDNVDVTPDYSDDEGSISDEDSLIEISLPGGHYVTRKEQEPTTPTMYIIPRKLTDSMPGSISQQPSLMEILAEFNDMNEEDNLIEIDISMGSIKCSRFEIEA